MAKRLEDFIANAGTVDKKLDLAREIANYSDFVDKLHRTGSIDRTIDMTLEYLANKYGAVSRVKLIKPGEERKDLEIDVARGSLPAESLRIAEEQAKETHSLALTSQEDFPPLSPTPHSEDSSRCYLTIPFEVRNGDIKYVPGVLQLVRGSEQRYSEFQIECISRIGRELGTAIAKGYYGVDRLKEELNRADTIGESIDDVLGFICDRLGEGVVASVHSARPEETSKEYEKLRVDHNGRVPDEYLGLVEAQKKRVYETALKRPEEFPMECEQGSISVALQRRVGGEKEIFGVLNVFKKDRQSGGLEREFMYEVARALGENLGFFHNRKVASEDYLTKLPPRRKFMEMLRTSKKDADEMNTSMYLAMIDIDHFKTLNDTRGHSVGDAALEGLGKMLNSLQENRYEGNALVTAVGRYGGEEFCVLVEGGNKDTACKIIDDLRREIANKGFANTGIQRTVSAGIAEYAPISSIDRLIDQADEALYGAKRTRNRVCFFDKNEKKIMAYEAGDYFPLISQE